MTKKTLIVRDHRDAGHGGDTKTNKNSGAPIKSKRMAVRKINGPASIPNAALIPINRPGMSPATIRSRAPLLSDSFGLSLQFSYPARFFETTEESNHGKTNSH